MASMNSDVATGRRMKGREGFTARIPGGFLLAFSRSQLPHLGLALVLGELLHLLAELALVDALVQRLPALEAFLRRQVGEAAAALARLGAVGGLAARAACATFCAAVPAPALARLRVERGV